MYVYVMDTDAETWTLRDDKCVSSARGIAMHVPIVPHRPRLVFFLFLQEETSMAAGLLLHVATCHQDLTIPHGETENETETVCVTQTLSTLLAEE